MAEWRVIPSFPDYEVSEYGTVRRCRKGIRNVPIGRCLKPIVSDQGYFKYSLRQAGRLYHRKAHLLVLEAFHGTKPFPKAQSRHLDGTRTNNHFTNLRWGTRSENEGDKVLHGRSNRCRPRLRDATGKYLRTTLAT